MKSPQAAIFGPVLYLSGMLTLRLCETRQLGAAIVMFGLAVSLCSLLLLMATHDEEDD